MSEDKNEIEWDLEMELELEEELARERELRQKKAQDDAMKKLEEERLHRERMYKEAMGTDEPPQVKPLGQSPSAPDTSIPESQNPVAEEVEAGAIPEPVFPDDSAHPPGDDYDILKQGVPLDSEPKIIEASEVVESEESVEEIIEAPEAEVLESSTDLVPTAPTTQDSPKEEKTGGLADLQGNTNLDAQGIVPTSTNLANIDGESEDTGGSNKGRIGDRLLEMGLITKDQLNVALQEKKLSGKLLGQIFVDLGFIEEETLSVFLAESSGFDVFDPKATIVDADCLAMIDKQTAMRHNVMPVSVSGSKISVAMSDPYDVVALDTLRQHLPKNLELVPLITTAKILSDAIDATYGYASSIKDILKELENEDIDPDDVAQLNEEDAFTHPIVRLVNALVFDAVKIGASDLHFEPEENFVRLRYRVDGVLHTAQTLHKQHWNGIAQRLKIMSGMNIADKLMPQDGRFELTIGGKRVDFRVSSLPTVHGENIVLRVLDQSESIMPLEALGFSPENLKKIKSAQSRPEGIIIVTGPTGSGKTTSLYSMLNEINSVTVNIQTLEDPVEYSLPMIRQTHVKEGVLEFADGIKALLRQDPDIIFIGEIRDGETANMALKAAMTGHQVYSTLHTNDSFGALPRLLDLHLKPGMLAGAIIAVFAQRLARRLCTACKEEYTPNEEECKILGVDPNEAPRIFRAPENNNCQVCGGTGYKGRVAVAEILMMDEDLDELLAEGKSKAEIKNRAVEKGFKSMKDDGILKILDGLTSIDAIAKVVDVYKE